MSASSEEIRRLTISDIGRMYADGERIPMLTAYDYPTARILDEAGIPMILVGDSLGQVVLGYETTVKVTMDEMLHHTRAVVRGTRRALVIGDMPFLTYATTDEATENAGRFMQDGGAQAVKVEGGVRTARIVEALVKSGVPVQGHIGWTPQSQHGLGGKVKVQGKSRDAARALLHDAIAIQEAGAFSIVLELVPSSSPRSSRRACASRPSASAPGPTAAARSRSSRTCSGWAPSARSTRGRTRTSRARSPTRPAAGWPTSPPAPSPALPNPSAWTTTCSTRRSGGTPATASPARSRR